MSLIEKAKIQDIPQIHQMVNYFADKGEMLPRPLSELYESIRDFFVVREGERVIACAALHVAWKDLAERRLEKFSNKAETGALGIPTVFCFTYQPDYFKRHRFVDIDKAELPRKVWTDCYRCPKFPNCDEVALIYHSEEAA